MAKAKNGDTVKVRYTGKLKNGEVFGSSKEHEPLTFVIGDSNVIPGIEKGVVGMEEGDTKSISIAMEEAYGARREDLMMIVKKSEFPDDILPFVGMKLQMTEKNKSPMNAIVSAINEEDVILDGNHPLAGETLALDVQLIEIS